MATHLDILGWTHKGSGGKTNGHVAILLRGGVEHDSAAANEADQTYISWWPEDGDRPFSKTPGASHTLVDDLLGEIGSSAQRKLQAGASPRPGQASLGWNTIPLHDGDYNPLAFASREDIDWVSDLLNPQTKNGGQHNRWAQFPTDVVSLRLDMPGQQLGLHAHAILTWWRAFRLGHTTTTNGQKSGYQFVSNQFNCASIVMRALIAGEAAFFEPPPSGFIYYSPLEVLTYARALQRKIESMNRNYDLYKVKKNEWQGKNRCETFIHPPNANTELPTVKEWERISDTNVSFAFLCKRREQTLAIDDELRKYHALKPWTDLDGASKRLTSMRKIFDKIGEYIATKPKGDRTNAMLVLGQRVLAVRNLQSQRFSKLVADLGAPPLPNFFPH